MTLEFGFLPRELNLDTGWIAISSRNDLQEVIKGHSSWPNVKDDWIYPGLRQQRSFSGSVRNLPYASRVFGLPKTHTITHVNADSSEHLQFLIWCLSFLLGIRLTTTEAGFLDATPIKERKLVDFLCVGGDLLAGLQLAEHFWRDNRTAPVQTKRLIAAVHALFVSQYPQSLQFERFLYLYTALDACFAVTKTQQGYASRITHEERIEWMCKRFGIEIPPWAINAGNGVEVAALRNNTLHEALFADEPLGFALHGAGSSNDITTEMHALVCRIVIAILGGEAADYVRAPLNSRNIFALDLTP